MMKKKIVDLTHSLHGEIPTWSGGCGWREEIKVDYPKGLRVQTYRCHAGIGTHIDAPSHFFEGAANVGEIALEKLIVEICVIDAKEEADGDWLLQLEHLERYEQNFGLIPEGSFVALDTGWARFWDEPLRYRNPDQEGKMHFPGFSAEAADFLVKRKVVGIGIDTLSPDGSNVGFPVHEKILGAGMYIVENLANLSRLPAKGAFVILFPQKVMHGTESSIRAAALI